MLCMFWFTDISCTILTIRGQYEPSLLRPNYFVLFTVYLSNIFVLYFASKRFYQKVISIIDSMYFSPVAIIL